MQDKSELDLLLKKLENCRNIQEAAYEKKLWEQKYLIPIQEKLTLADSEGKKELGVKLNFLKKEAENIFHRFKDNFLVKKNIKELDLSISNQYLENYCFNPLTEVKSILINFFDKLNFQIQSGNEIVSVEENFDSLDIPKNHPSYSNSETFFLGEKFLLRPHCTVNSVVFLKNHHDKNIPACCATIGKVYRKDDETPRHVHQFTQLDFVWVQKNLNLGNLKWFLLLICNTLFGSKKEYRFRNSYFPFTQPSFEIDMKCNCDSSEECSICKGSGWIEILGAGMLKRKILSNLGFSEEHEGLAGGLGLERIALIKYHISDVRKIYENNFVFLKNDY